MEEHPVIPLRDAPGARVSWSRPKPLIYAWALAEILFVTSPFQISSRVRVKVLRLFGARIGDGVTFRPRTRVLFPWNLDIGDNCWIGDSVWIHNQDQVRIENDVVISQGTFITTGSHSHRTDMGLITAPVQVKAGAWITSGVTVLGGSVIGTNALITPGAVVSGSVPAECKFGPPSSTVQGSRYTRTMQKKETT